MKLRGLDSFTPKSWKLLILLHNKTHGKCENYSPTEETESRYVTIKNYNTLKNTNELALCRATIEMAIPHDK